MDNKKKKIFFLGLIFEPTVDSIFLIGRQRLKKQEGFIAFKVLILIALLILILLILFL
jgi:hypothetical protein